MTMWRQGGETLSLSRASCDKYTQQTACVTQACSTAWPSRLPGPSTHHSRPLQREQNPRGRPSWAPGGPVTPRRPEGRRREKAPQRSWPAHLLVVCLEGDGASFSVLSWKQYMFSIETTRTTGSRDSQTQSGGWGTRTLLLRPNPPARAHAKGPLGRLSPSRPGPATVSEVPRCGFFSRREGRRSSVRADTRVDTRTRGLAVAFVGRRHVQRSVEARAGHLPVPHTRGHGPARPL